MGWPPLGGLHEQFDALAGLGWHCHGDVARNTFILSPSSDPGSNQVEDLGSVVSGELGLSWVGSHTGDRKVYFMIGIYNTQRATR